ncbi:MAG: endopeptidase La, partial [Alphaproteobacteria bacterium]|nr:endopeptidase La [Alphaproteobacteria bacterium]
PKTLKNHALKEGEWALEEDALRDLIRYYTREAGVRSLEREIANLARKSVRKIQSGKADSITITPENLGDYAGVRKFRFGETDKEDQVGIVTGLAWTEVGGDLLTIEAVRMPGRGNMKVTGNLKDVMKESISAANSFVQSRAPSLGIKPTVFRSSDIHVHVPEGATPKDGPSAGIGMMTAIVSVLTGVPVRKDIAMTGEITLRGGVKTVLIPQENEKDLAEIPDNVKAGLEIIPVETVDQVLRHALTEAVEPVEWTEADEAALAALASQQSGEAGGPAVAH